VEAHCVLDFKRGLDPPSHGAKATMRTCIAFLRARLPVVHATTLAGVAILALATGGAHAAAPCNELETVGGGALGISPGPLGPPASLGWDVPNPRRTVPLHMRCRDADGRVLTPADIAPPVLVASKVPSGAATSDGLLRSRGHGGPDGAFEFAGGMWRFNLELSNFTAPGAFEIRAAAGGDDLLLGAPTLTLMIN
jgi:hypothetical protein